MNICDAVAVRTEHLVRSVAAAVDLLSSTPFEARRGLSGETSVRAGPNDSLVNVCALSKGRRAGTSRWPAFSWQRGSRKSHRIYTYIRFGAEQR